MSAIGIAISGGPNPADMIDLVGLAERLGYESAWVAEGHGGDQFAILSACAVRTTHPAWHQHQQCLHPHRSNDCHGRIYSRRPVWWRLHPGASHKAQVEPEHGMVYTKPLTRIRETVAIVRDLRKV